ncbi:MAG: chromophore lyase CpcT/CpeT [Xanthomonadales bacterium]|jgi:hypothetical protein|nr:chromophore lyase CpcT/CpeT [Xanthomonadales bacterium]
MRPFQSGLRGAVLGAAVLLAACAATPTAMPDPAGEVADLLAGSYSSQSQSETDKAFFDVRLGMRRIWPERAGEHWLYVEQAMATTLDRPYRQRVYRIEATDGGAISHVYTLPGDPLRYAGAHRDPVRLAGLTPAELEERRGCAIHLVRHQDGSYAGATRERECPSDLRGASYATSEVVLSAERLDSWDRGYDRDGKQVWGAVTGAYRFDRLPGE